jgi:hypothetical protein
MAQKKAARKPATKKLGKSKKVGEVKPLSISTLKI